MVGLTPQGGSRQVPASAPAVIARAATEIGEPATSWAVEASAKIVLQVAEDFRRAGTPGMMTGSEREGCEACLLTTLVGLRRGTPAQDIVAPEGARENIRLSVRQGVPIDTVLRTVWACHTQVQDALLAVLEDEVRPESYIREVRALNAALFSYVNSYVADLMAGYQDELSLWHGHLPAEQLRIISLILEGGDPPADAERILGLRLAARHLIGVAWHSADSGHIEDRESVLSRFGSDAGRILGAAGTLTLHREGLTQFWWSFLGAPPGNYAQILRGASRPSWLRLAIGSPGSGVEGLRASHFGAGQAARVGRLAPDGLFWAYQEVSRLALLVADPQAARAYVRDQLAGLLEGDPKTADLRETLRQFLANGNSRVAAAQVLHVAPNTVAYRVRRAGGLLGRSFRERNVDTLMALELAHEFPQLMD